ncbi:hypothetical protein P167DRAFT_408212 [Morchella conica CCBAS932]|uniref:Histone deacetylase n=1 Tax=Morchella conica CCBAS932 TaxID=1392247 RepID=A0A3N4L4Q5_9PEZI|nr:hypothetical protein P167DRAFT_408212 [Morchella conica CCBAS932]
MPFVPGSDTDMLDAPNGTSAAHIENPPTFPICVNGHTDVTFTGPYNPSRSEHASPVADQTSAITLRLSGDVSASREDSTEKDRQMSPNKALPISSLKTGLCYDTRMMYHEQINEEDHPEQPKRIFSIYSALVGAGFVEDGSLAGAFKDGIMKRVDAREVTEKEALLAHSKDHWDYISSTSAMDPIDLREAWQEGDSVYFCPDSFSSAKLSCGGVIECAKAVVESQVKNAIAVVRPPGHHAEFHKPMGFCLFNNVCVAAQVMLKKYPETIRKVLILDWDVHHGNGTQAIFYDNPHVLYMSIHRFDGGKFYPEGQHGNYDKCGVDEGVGMNVNVPWNNVDGGMGDGDYMYAFQRVIMPIALEFNPDLVLISAGFDAAVGDELGKCMVTPAGYAHMTHMLMRLANGKVVVCLEGGYNLDSISHSALAVTKVLLGEPPGRLHDGDKVRPSASRDVEKCVIQQSRYWRCMRLTESDVIRSHQAKVLWEKHRMSDLKIFRDTISVSFENQVLATTNSYKAETLVLLVHDPPSEDVGNMYIDWAVQRGYAVMDVNIPQALTTKEGTLAEQHEYEVMRQTEEICMYLWDNYIEISDAKNIILLGVGDAFVGILYLLANRECRERVKGVIGIVGDENGLRACKPGIHGDILIDWYFNNSLIFCTQEHNVWGVRRGKKKHGTIRKSPATNLQDVLREAYDEMTHWLTDRLPPPPPPGVIRRPSNS